MTDDRAREIFTGATKLPQEERAAFLDEQCGADADLRAEVEELIKNDSGLDPTLEADAQPRPTPGLYHKGDTIDAYTIQRRIGRGGMGAVYLATQTEPIKRSVALKFILSGEPSEEVIARFEQEKQTLVNMNHPGIAKVFDAGTTPVGYPYFVMEYIEGEELDTFCDRNKLNTTERLQLFARICDAVQHAQQKGFIHRDLKPGNILVVSSDEGEPQPKVIDFGIAKATSVDDHDDQPMLSRHGQLIGTYEYMSPEQAEGLSDIDIRSDVYSLGVILYELLSGRRPFDLKNRAHAELLRVIREDDPPKPSSRLSSIEGDDGTKIADDRKTKQSELASTLRKELDWIPLKALRKDREERYDSSAAMGKDVRRYLDHEALEAGPESARYRLKKLVRRHKVPFIAAALVVVALVAGIISTSIFLVQAEAQRQIAEDESTRANAVKDFLSEMLASVDPRISGAMDKELMTLVLKNAAQDIGQAMQDQPLVEWELRQVIGKTYLGLGMYGDAEPHIIRALKLAREHLSDVHPITLWSFDAMGGLLLKQGKFDDALPYLTEALKGRRRVLGDEHPDTLGSINNMGLLLYQQGKFDEAMKYYVEALEALRRNLGDEHQHTLMSIDNMGLLLTQQGEYDEAMPYIVEALEGRRRVLGDEHPETLLSIEHMGLLLFQQGKYDDALPYLTEALKGCRRVLGDEHPETLASIHNMGMLLFDQGKNDEAMAYYTEALETKRRVLGDDHASTTGSIGNMGNLLKQQGKYDEAMPYYAEALEGFRRRLGDDHSITLTLIAEMGNLLSKQGKYDEAKPYIVEALETRRRVLGDDHPSTLASINKMGSLLIRQGKYDEAMPYYAEALEGFRRRLGDDHSITLTLIAEMGNLLYMQGKVYEAKPYIVEALETRRRVLGDEHSDTLRSIDLMGGVLDQQGKYDEAMEYYAEALAGRRSVLGDEHPETLASINNMGHLLSQQGKYDDALPYFTEALKGRRRVRGDEHPSTVNSIYAMAILLYQQGKYDEALPYLAEAIETRRRILGDDHPHTHGSIYAMGSLYEAWHEEEPEKGYDAKAAEYRALHEELSGTTPAEAAAP